MKTDIEKKIEQAESLLTELKTELLKNKEPKFNVGDWLKYMGSNYAPCPIRRIKRIESASFAIDDNNDGISYTSDYRLATPQEIESHLRKICDAKGLMKDGRVLSSTYGSVFKFNGMGETRYSPSEDALSNGGMFLYRQGKFAEVIPEKERLPRTKEEFRTFLRSAEEFDLFLPFPKGTITDFLNQYED